ncbi:MAG: hypothetical protein ACOC6E_03740 [Thermodesulfobacteriota bacterium]
MYSIGIRYCGGCNPQIDRARAVKELQADLAKGGEPVDFTTDRERPVDLILLVNGCSHACLEEAYLEQGGTPPFISVEGEMVDRRPVREDHIPEVLTKRITELIKSSS